jgi:hypothetical protein
LEKDFCNINGGKTVINDQVSERNRTLKSRRKEKEHKKKIEEKLLKYSNSKVSHLKPTSFLIFLCSYAGCLNLTI